MNRVFPALLLLIGAACSGAPGPSGRAGAHADALRADAPGSADGPASPEAAGSAAPTPHQPAVTRAECESLLDHMVSLAMAAHAGTVPPELVPTAEQVARIRADLAPEFLPACLALDRATYECEAAATSREQMLACSR